jgi:ketosteroid isomerase-like protein
MPSNVEKLERMFDRFWNEGDPSAGEGVLAPDVEWLGMQEVGLGGLRSGPRGVYRFFNEWLEMWDDYSNEAEFEEITPDVILAKSHFRGRGKGSGIEFETELGQVWEFKDGLVVRQTMYRTYDEARAAAIALRD